MRILVVDDEKEIRDLLEMVLKHNDPLTEVEKYNTARGAIERLQQSASQFDLVLTDWNIKPDGNGNQVIKAALQAGIPVNRTILMSGLDIEDARAKSMTLNVIPKPFNMQELLGTIQNIVSEQVA